MSWAIAACRLKNQPISTIWRKPIAGGNTRTMSSKRTIANVTSKNSHAIGATNTTMTREEKRWRDSRSMVSGREHFHCISEEKSRKNLSGSTAVSRTDVSHRHHRQHRLFLLSRHQLQLQLHRNNPATKNSVPIIESTHLSRRYSSLRLLKSYFDIC